MVLFYLVTPMSGAAEAQVDEVDGWENREAW